MTRVKDYTLENEVQVYKEMFGALPQSMFLLDRNKRIVGIFNAAEETLAGIPIEEVVGRNIMDYVNDPESPFFQACSMLNSTFDPVFRTGVPLKFQYMVLDSYLEATITKIAGDKILSQVRDISDIVLKQREIEAKKHNELSMALMAGGLTSWSYDVAAHKIMAQHDNTVIGHEMSLNDFMQTIAPEYRYRVQEVLDDILLRGCKHAHQVFQIRDLEGVLQWVDVHAIPHEYNQDGEVTVIIGSQKRVTAEYEHRERMRTLIKQNELLLNNTNAGFVFLTPDLEVEWENVSRVFDDPQVVGLFGDGKLCRVSDIGEANYAIITRALESGNMASGKFRTSSGGVVESLAQPVYDDDKQIEGIALRLMDVTEKELAITELADAKERAEQSDKLKSAFLANMSHEIRTPLNAIVGFASLIPQAETEQEKQSYIDIVNSNSEVLLNLINDILDLSKIEAGYFTCNNSPFDLSGLYADLNVFFRQKVRAGVELSCAIPQEPYIVNLDRVRVSQVVTNFMTNAIKFTNTGHIRMGFEPLANSVRLYVEDTGCGMDESQLSRVFGRFEKFNSFEQGTGLGTSIAKAIVDACGGQIGVESQPNVGTTFWAILPFEGEA